MARSTVQESRKSSEASTVEETNKRLQNGSGRNSNNSNNTGRKREGNEDNLQAAGDISEGAPEQLEMRQNSHHRPHKEGETPYSKLP